MKEKESWLCIVGDEREDNHQQLSTHHQQWINHLPSPSLDSLLIDDREDHRYVTRRVPVGIS